MLIGPHFLNRQHLRDLPHHASGIARHEGFHGLLNDVRGDDRVTTLHSEPQNGRARNPFDQRWHALHTFFRLLRPVEALFGPQIQGGDIGTARQEDMAGGEPQEVLRIAAQVHLALLAMNADAPQDQHPGFDFARMLQELFKCLAWKQRQLHLDAICMGNFPGHFEVGLVDFRQPGVDDLLVELLLLFKAEHFGGLFREHTDDAVEGDIVQERIVDGDNLNRPVKGFP